MDILCDELQKVAERVFKRQEKLYDLIINIPPGTTKSTIVTIMFPVWCWLHEEFDENGKEIEDLTGANLRFISASYAAEIALEHALKSRDIIQSNKFRKNFPHIILRRDKEAKSHYENTRGGSRMSTSVGGKATGAHGHFILVDDPLNPKQAMAETRRELKAANDWMDRTLSTRKIDKRITVTILIMQRLHEDDPTGHLLLKKDKKIRHICLPDKVSDMVKPEKLKENYIDGLLDPERMPHSVLAEAKVDLGSIAYAGQFEQRPAPEGGSMFQTQGFRLLKEINPNHILEAVRYWDKAATEGGTGAQSCGVLMYRMSSWPEFVVAHVKAGRWSTAVREANIKLHAQMDNELFKTTTWTEQEPGSGGKESAEATIKNLKGYTCKADKVTGSKEARAEPYAAQVEVGNIGVLVRDWTQAFIDEHEVFPAGALKDRVDGASGAFNKLNAKKSKVGVW